MHTSICFFLFRGKFRVVLFNLCLCSHPCFANMMRRFCYQRLQRGKRSVNAFMTNKHAIAGLPRESPLSLGGANSENDAIPLRKIYAPHLFACCASICVKKMGNTLHSPQPETAVNRYPPSFPFHFQVPTRPLIIRRRNCT